MVQQRTPSESSNRSSRQPTLRTRSGTGKGRQRRLRLLCSAYVFLLNLWQCVVGFTIVAVTSFMPLFGHFDDPDGRWLTRCAFMQGASIMVTGVCGATFLSGGSSMSSSWEQTSGAAQRSGRAMRQTLYEAKAQTPLSRKFIFIYIFMLTIPILIGLLVVATHLQVVAPSFAPGCGICDQIRDYSVAGLFSSFSTNLELEHCEAVEGKRSFLAESTPERPVTDAARICIDVAVRCDDWGYGARLNGILDYCRVAGSATGQQHCDAYIGRLDELLGNTSFLRRSGLGRAEAVAERWRSLQAVAFSGCFVNLVDSVLEFMLLFIVLQTVQVCGVVFMICCNSSGIKAAAEPRRDYGLERQAALAIECAAKKVSNVSDVEIEMSPWHVQGQALDRSQLDQESQGTPSLTRAGSRLSPLATPGFSRAGSQSSLRPSQRRLRSRSPRPSPSSTPRSSGQAYAAEARRHPEHTPEMERSQTMNLNQMDARFATKQDRRPHRNTLPGMDSRQSWHAIEQHQPPMVD